MSYSSGDYEYYDSYDEMNDFELNPYDSDTFPEPHRRHNAEMPAPPVIPDNNDPAIIFSPDIQSSRDFICKNLGCTSSTLKSLNVHGLVVLRLQDFALIRKDSRNNRKLTHLLVIPCTETFAEDHSDFAKSLIALNQ